MTQEDLIRNWYEKRKEGSLPSISADKDSVRTSSGLGVLKRMPNGFIMANTDVLSVAYRGTQIFRSAIRVLGNRAVPVSFCALELTKIPTNDLALGYKPSGKYDQVCFPIILKVANTNRTLLCIRDHFWVGIVEVNGDFRDPLAAVDSLIPKAVRDFLKGKDTEINLVPITKDEVFRNGEYYFIPRPGLNPKKVEIKKWQAINPKDHTIHNVRDLVIVDGVTYMRGTVRHRKRRMVGGRFFEGPLGVAKRIVEPWYEVVKSTQINSWKGVYFWG